MTQVEQRTDGCLTRGICEITLRAEDLGRLECFYRSVFGCTLISRDDDRIWLSCGSRARLGVWTPGKKEFGDQGGRHVHFAVSVGRGALGSLCQRLDEMGIAYRGPVEHPGGDRSVYIEDPEGNVVEAWDFFEHGDGARAGVQALTEDAA